MSNSKVHSQGKVPFSWENKPGVSKVITTVHQEYPTTTIIKLPPPPCPPDQTKKARVVVHELQVPLPPCAFQPPPSRSLSKRGDDPFLTAYKECTKTTSKNKGKLFGVYGRTKKSMFFGFSCTKSCSVGDDNLVKISQLPHSYSDREERSL